MLLVRRQAALCCSLLLLASACASTGDAIAARENPATTSTTAAVETSSTTNAPATTAPTTNTPPTPICAELLVGAKRVHPSNEDTPIADLDGDGLDDELWLTMSTEFTVAVQAVLSRDGSVTDALDGLFFVDNFDGVAASTDLDGDGLDEVFYALGGNTALTGTVLELDGCTLRAITGDVLGGEDEPFTYTYFALGNGCAPTGCFFSVSCTGEPSSVEVILTSIFPTVSVLSPDFDEALLDQPIEELEVTFSQTIVTIADGVASVVSSSEPRSVTPGEIPEWMSLPEISCEV